jgi:hypothetical protein
MTIKQGHPTSTMALIKEYLRLNKEAETNVPAHAGGRILRMLWRDRESRQH